MESGRWQEVKRIFEGALDLPPESRESYLREACPDEEMRAEVAALIDSAEIGDDFLAAPAAVLLSDTLSDAGRRIGPYQIIREIGEGGMGVVYLAERVDEFRQKVALKLMRRGMAYARVIARFRRERQILAGLEHPNIARLLDGGATSDGQPFFVMEYIDGAPLTQYCASKHLGVDERLKLFRQICGAVHYAHQNLIVHRDIKPGNILVTEDGTPKLLDFGIAKLLDRTQRDHGDTTEAGMGPMTPEYASPEQIRGEPLTTSTDVYSLGILLYELLTGIRPYAITGASFAEMERAVCEKDPPMPSAAVVSTDARRLAGDLDTIVVKAIDKISERRYSSAEQLSEDIRRHLDGEPVQARPPTLNYRIQKFARRNRTAVIAGGFVFASLVAGLSLTAWQAHVARMERLRAEARFNEVRGLAESMLLDVNDKIREGASQGRQAVVDKALQYLTILEKEAQGDRNLQLDLSEAYLKLGDVQGNPNSSGQSDSGGALARYNQALALLTPILRDDPHNAKALTMAARAKALRGDVLALRGKDDEAFSSIHEAIDGFQQGANQHPNDIANLIELSRAWEALGDRRNPGLSPIVDKPAAEDSYRKALDVWTKILALNPAEPHVARALAVLNTKLGNMADYQGRPEEARRRYQVALESIHRADLKAVENLSIETGIRRRLLALDAAKNPEAALDQYREHIAFREKAFEEDTENVRVRTDVVILLLDAAQIEDGIPKHVPEAIQTYRRALELLDPLLKEDPNNLRHQSMAADVGLRLSRTLTNHGDRTEAAKAAQRSLAILKNLADRPSAEPWQSNDYADALLHAQPSSVRNAALAMKYAQIASDSNGGKNPDSLELLAEAQFAAGHAAEAGASEQKAKDLTKDKSEQDRMAALIKKYHARASK